MGDVADADRARAPPPTRKAAVGERAAAADGDAAADFVAGLGAAAARARAQSRRVSMARNWMARPAERRATVGPEPAQRPLRGKKKG